MHSFLQIAARGHCTDDWSSCDGEWIDGLLIPCNGCREAAYRSLFPLGQTLDWLPGGPV